MGITNEQYDAIMRDYKRTQMAHARELQEHRQEIYEKFPEYLKLEESVASTGASLARDLLNHRQTDLTPEMVGQFPASSSPEGGLSSRADRKAIDAARRKMDAHVIRTARKKEAFLTANGYPKDYLEMHYTCPDCKDTGYIGTEKCHCFRKAVTLLLYRQSNLMESPGEEEFRDFQTDYYSDQITDDATGLTHRQMAERARDTCLQFAHTFGKGAGNLFLYGDTGLGKTFLSRCIAHTLIRNGYSVLYFSAYRLFELSADLAFGREEGETPASIGRHIFSCDLLIIDDLGTEMTNSFVATQLFAILNERALQNKSTVISTNLSLTAFARIYSERIFSRISSSYTMLKLAGEDIRIQKKLRRR